jgi:hypothetical protein
MTIEDLMKLAVPALIGVLAGIVSSVITTRQRMKEVVETFKLEQRAKDQETKAKVQIQYLNPLQIAALDLRDRIQDIQNKIEGGDPLLRNTMQELKSRDHHGNQYVEWANGFGHYALSTLYLTNVYLASVSKIRTELPFVELTSGEDQELLNHLARVRSALGGDYGIWENLQDSFGHYVKKKRGTLMNYKEFCSFIYDDANFLWFMRLVDFYRDIDLKTIPQRYEMINSLDELLKFLNRKSAQVLPKREPKL